MKTSIFVLILYNNMADLSLLFYHMQYAWIKWITSLFKDTLIRTNTIIHYYDTWSSSWYGFREGTKKMYILMVGTLFYFFCPLYGMRGGSESEVRWQVTYNYTFVNSLMCLLLPLRSVDKLAACNLLRGWPEYDFSPPLPSF